MAFDKFMIAPMEVGLETDVKPWLLPDTAFAELNNAYIFRGRVRKRFGSKLMGYGFPNEQMAPLYSRLRINIGTTDGAGLLGSGTNPLPSTVDLKVGMQFSVGEVIFTVNTAVPGIILSNTFAQVMVMSLPNGAYGIASPLNPNTDVYWYPAEPVMGLTNYEKGPIDNQPSYAFDTRFAYVFAGGFWQRSNNIEVPAVNVPVWHGDDTNFFWTANWEGITSSQVVMFVSNFYVVNADGPVDATDDPIWTYGNPANTWDTFTPKFLVAGVGNFIQTALLIIPFKNRLLLLNTIETSADGTTNISYLQRVRFSHNGSPFAASAFLEPNQVGATGAGFEDAPTEEQIVSAEFIKDRLIVYFERSTWELAYTGNEVRPFVWQKLNTELGSESTFSTVPFDKIVMTVGNTGIHACNGSNVERIDDKIPDQVFQISNEGKQRVAGIRDYYTEMVYWTIPWSAQNANQTYPSRVLVYNYKTGSWAYNDDCLTCFGYFEQQQGQTWASSTDSWQDAQYSWDSGVLQSNFRQVIAGNQQGFVFIIDPQRSRNANVMQITDMVNVGTGVNLTIIDHTLTTGNYITIENPSDIIGELVDGIHQVIFIDTNTVRINPAQIEGIYSGGGTAARVSNIMIKSKQWNFYIQEGATAYVPKMDFLVDRTQHGEVTIDYFLSSSNYGMLAPSGPLGTGALQGNSVLETSAYALIPFEQYQDRLWHPIYLQAEGETVQILISMSPEQIVDEDIAFSGFELHGIIVFATKTSSSLL